MYKSILHHNIIGPWAGRLPLRLRSVAVMEATQQNENKLNVDHQTKQNTIPNMRACVYGYNNHQVCCACMSINLATYLSICLSVRVSVCMSVRVSVCSCVCLFVCLSVRVSVCSLCHTSDYLPLQLIFP